MYASTGVTQYWYPMARGFISAVKLENMNTELEISNTTGSPQQVRLEIWVTCVGGHGAYSAMSNGNNSNQYACRAFSDIVTISSSGELNISVILQERDD